VITSLGYAFQEDGARGRRIVFSGDTRPSVGILNAARGADLLVHEATFVSGRAPWAQKIGHCTALQTAELARSAGVGALALTHISARDDRPDILAEARTIFPGAVLPDDLEVLTVPPRQLGAAAARLRAGWSNVVHRVLRVAPDVDGLAS
jgi:ribonuclease Z